MPEVRSQLWSEAGSDPLADLRAFAERVRADSSVINPPLYPDWPSPEAVARRVRGDDLAGEPLWTIGDALSFLDPRPNRRTLSRWLRGLESVGTRPLPQGGPPARLYRAREIMRMHASWAAGISV